MSLEKVTAIGGRAMSEGLEKALTELQGLTIDVLTGAASNTDIPVANIDIEDTVLKALHMVAGVPAAITVTITDRRASGTITSTGTVAGDKVSVAGEEFTAVASTGALQNVKPREFVVGATNNATAANLAAAINAYATDVIATVATNVVTIKARAAGTAGNSLALADAAGGGHLVKSGATLSGGSATPAIKTATNTTGNTVVLFWYNKR